MDMIAVAFSAMVLPPLCAFSQTNNAQHFSTSFQRSLQHSQESHPRTHVLCRMSATRQHSRLIILITNKHSIVPLQTTQPPPAPLWFFSDYSAFGFFFFFPPFFGVFSFSAESSSVDVSSSTSPSPSSAGAPNGLACCSAGNGRSMSCPIM